MRSSSPSSSINRRPAPSRRAITSSSVVAVLAREGGQCGAALLHGLELAGAVDVEAAEVAGELGRHLGELERHRVEAVADRGEGRVVRRRRGRSRAGPPRREPTASGWSSPDWAEIASWARVAASRRSSRLPSRSARAASSSSSPGSGATAAILGEVGAQLLGLTGTAVAVGGELLESARSISASRGRPRRIAASRARCAAPAEPSSASRCAAADAAAPGRTGRARRRAGRRARRARRPASSGRRRRRGCGPRPTPCAPG